MTLKYVKPTPFPSIMASYASFTPATIFTLSVWIPRVKPSVATLIAGTRENGMDSCPAYPLTDSVAKPKYLPMETSLNSSASL